MKRIIKIVIERSKDLYSAYAENVEGIYAAGETVEEVKQSVEDSINLLKKYNKLQNVPAILKGDYQYKFTTKAE